MKKYEKVLLGKVDNKSIYLSPPSWDCGWYWGFGCLGNNNSYYHVDGLKKIETYNMEKKVWEYRFVNLYDGFKEHFGDSLMIRKSMLWEFTELFETFYKLKDIAEVYNRGGSHYTTNPCKDLIVNEDEVKRINEVILPAIFEEIYKIIELSQSLPKCIKEIVKLNVDGDTSLVVEYMIENLIAPEDLKDAKGITYNDYQIIHSYYWKAYHAIKRD